MDSDIFTGYAPQVIEDREAAKLLDVSMRTLHGWIQRGLIPSIEVPSRTRTPSYQIPVQGLIDAMSSTRDLAGNLESFYRSPEVSDRAVRAAIAKTKPRRRAHGRRNVSVRLRSLLSHLAWR